MLKFVVSILLVFFYGSVYAESSCLDTPTAHALFAEFQILKTTEKVNIDLCDQQSAASTVIKTLLFLKELGDLNAEQGPFIKNWLGASPYVFFKSRVKKIVLDDSKDCVGLSQVWPSERAQKVMHVCTKASQYEVLTLAEAFVHEARHLETFMHNHAVCITGENYGRESCDESFESGGAYAVGVEFLMRVHQSTQLDSRLREQAHQMALRALRERFNTTPSGLRTYVSLQERRPKILR